MSETGAAGFGEAPQERPLFTPEAEEVPEAEGREEWPLLGPPDG